MVVVVALIIAVVGLVGGLAVARGRRRMPSAAPIDPFVLSERWRRHVSLALATQRRYRDTVRATPDGPLRERLTAIGDQVNRCVDECWQIAKRGDDLDAAVERLHLPSLQTQLQRASDDASRASLQSQIDAAQRITTSRDDTDQRLKVLTTRMGELVAQAAEVSVGVDNTEELGSGVDDVVTQLQSLRMAIDELNHDGRQSPST